MNMIINYPNKESVSIILLFLRYLYEKIRIKWNGVLESDYLLHWEDHDKISYFLLAS